MVETSQKKSVPDLALNTHIVFPNQLFERPEINLGETQVYIIEEFLFFKQYSFHKQKIAYHRASMKAFSENLKARGVNVIYIDSNSELSDIRILLKELVAKGIASVSLYDPTDDWLMKRIKKFDQQLEIVVHASPLFINNKEELSNFFRTDKQFFFQTTFYKQQRKRFNILIDDSGDPVGGQWTYDVDNRKKYPKNKIAPPVQYPSSDRFWKEAVAYTEKNFSNNPGNISDSPRYPYTKEQSEEWLDQFLQYRFHEFGPYEDAIVKEELILHHSVLTPMLNVGLIDPRIVVNEAISFAEENNVPLNSLEGFIRQIIGWREFIRGMYELKGRTSRTLNYWNFTRKLPSSFYNGTTGIPPIDETIKKVLRTGYAHHIERLMLLGNFMLLCEIDPDDVYQWFMELFIDSYDWVMVPNVYGMSQFADGGLFATKPYISGSNYVKKMSNYKSGEWEQIWNGLFWRFIHKHQAFFSQNARTAMIYRNYKRIDENKMASHISVAEDFLATLK